MNWTSLTSASGSAPDPPVEEERGVILAQQRQTAARRRVLLALRLADGAGELACVRACEELRNARIGDMQHERTNASVAASRFPGAASTRDASLASLCFSRA